MFKGTIFIDLTSLYICLCSLIVSSPFFLTNTTQYPHERVNLSIKIINIIHLRNICYFFQWSSLHTYSSPYIVSHYCFFAFTGFNLAFFLLSRLSPLLVLPWSPSSSTFQVFTFSFYLLLFYDIFLSLFFSRVQFWFLVVACSVTLVFFRATQNHLDLHTDMNYLICLSCLEESSRFTMIKKSLKEGFRFHFPLWRLSCVRHPLLRWLVLLKKKRHSYLFFQANYKHQNKVGKLKYILISIYEFSRTFSPKKVLNAYQYECIAPMCTCGRLFLQETNERTTIGVRRVGRQLIWISFILVSCLFYFYLVLSSHCHWISFDIIFRDFHVYDKRHENLPHTRNFFFSFRWLHFFSPSFIVYMFRLWPRLLVSGGRRMFDWRMEKNSYTWISNIW